MIIITVLISLLISQAEATPVMFTSFNDQKIQVDVKKHSGSALFVDENCPRCKSLIKRMHKNCTSFKKGSFAVFATGETKNKRLKRKVKQFIKKGVLVYTHPEVQELLNLGLSAVPSYIDKNKELFTGDRASFKAFLKDKICIK